MLLLYCQKVTPRLQYIVDFFNKELFDEPILVTTDGQPFQASNIPRINYSNNSFSEHEFFLQPHPLLFQHTIEQQEVGCFEINFHKAFFETHGDFPFDIFAASFYLLSRYEEYLPHQKDEFGRYAHTNSLAFREEFLHLPLINLWMEEFKKSLLHKFPNLPFKRKQFKCVLSYDIDTAYAYKHKGFIKTAGGIAKSIVSGQWSTARERVSVLQDKKKDPFDCFEWLDALHLYCRLKPYYFFLVAKKQIGVDKNTDVNEPSFRSLIEYYANSYKIGIHPSWQSGDDENLLKEELEWLEVMADKKIVSSRHHFIRFTLPHTYRRLIDAGIQKDFSMGYGSINGFRASVCSSFYWYDLVRETATSLLLYPFCFMDANSFYEQKYTPQQTYAELIRYYEMVKKLKGILITIWHNSILGTSQQFKGWPEMFELFMKETVYWDAYYDEG